MLKTLSLIILATAAFATDVYDINGNRLVQVTTADGDVVWVRADTLPVRQAPPRVIVVERVVNEPQVVYVQNCRQPEPQPVQESNSGIRTRDVVAFGVGTVAGMILQKHHKKLGF
jgi:hypothetical protein